MRTQKRAKSVSFGKKPAAAATKPTEVKKEPIVADVAEEKKPEVEIPASTPWVESEEKKETTPEEKTPKVEETTETEEEVKADKEEEKVSEEKSSTELSTTAPDIDEPDKSPEETTPEPEKEKEEEPAISVEKPTEAPKEEEPKKEVEAASAEKAEDNAFTLSKSVFSSTDGLYNDKKKKKPVLYFFVVAAIAFVLGLAVMWGVDYGMKQSKGMKLPEISLNKPTVAPTEASTPTEEPAKKVDLSAYSIKVLNGSGVVGEAAKVKASLVDAGFTVSATGNADQSTYKKTLITVNKEVNKDYIKKLEEELQKTYTLDDVVTASTKQATGVVVVIGSTTK